MDKFLWHVQSFFPEEGVVLPYTFEGRVVMGQWRMQTGKPPVLILHTKDKRFININDITNSDVRKKIFDIMIEHKPKYTIYPDSLNSISKTFIMNKSEIEEFMNIFIPADCHSLFAMDELYGISADFYPDRNDMVKDNDYSPMFKALSNGDEVKIVMNKSLAYHISIKKIAELVVKYAVTIVYEIIRFNHEPSELNYYEPSLAKENKEVIALTSVEPVVSGSWFSWWS